MSKKSAYISILIATSLIIAAGFVFNIAFVKTLTYGTLSKLSEMYLAIGAAVCAFIFMGSKRYWLYNIVAAVILALFLQMFLYGGSVTLMPLLSRILAFLSIVYVLNFIKLLVNK